MGRPTVPNAPKEDWRERLLWTSLSVGLIALLLLGLVSLARWGERSAVAGTGPLGVDRLPGSTALPGELLVPPSAFAAASAPTSSAAQAALPAVGASVEAASTAGNERATRWKCIRVPGVRTRQAVRLVEHDGDLCEPAR